MKFKPYKYNPHLITASFVLRFGGNKNESLKIDNNSLLERVGNLLYTIHTRLFYSLLRFQYSR